MIEKKVDKTDFSKVHSTLDDFEKKLKHISVLLTQISMAIHKDIDKVKLSENQSIMKNENILTQSKLICNWIMNRNVNRSSASSVCEKESQSSEIGQNYNFLTLNH